MEMSEPSPDFLNQVIEINTVFSPTQLLNEMKAIEVKMGRTEKGNYKSRIIDLDILLYGNRIIDTDELTVPQRELLNRPFAIIPLVEIAPNIIHPVTKKSISEYITKSSCTLVTLFEEYAATSR
jgi:2-amino-4-hydroxy-6-hydroxymethyldihydropteridine diphosphokinase